MLGRLVSTHPLFCPNVENKDNSFVPSTPDRQSSPQLHRSGLPSLRGLLQAKGHRWVQPGLHQVRPASSLLIGLYKTPLRGERILSRACQRSVCLYIFSSTCLSIDLATSLPAIPCLSVCVCLLYVSACQSVCLLHGSACPFIYFLCNSYLFEHSKFVK